MRVFVTGATGFVGSAVVRELLEHGHDVVGLARSSAAADALARAGATVHRGSVEDLDSLRRGASGADAAVHTAFFHKLTHAGLGTRLRIVAGGSPGAAVSRFMGAALAADRNAIETIGRALTGPDRALVATFGTMALSAGKVGTEDDDIDPTSAGGPRGATESTVVALADSGIRASVVRLPPVVHGDGDHAGFVPQLIAAARKHSNSAYVGDGSNRWGAAHRSDVARLFVAALEHGRPGARYHGVAEGGIPVVDIATEIGRGLGLPVTSVSPSLAAKRFGFVGPFAAVDNPVTSALTRSRLGWEPTGPTLLADLQGGSYFAR